MSALLLRQHYAQALAITVVDSPEVEASAVIRLGPSALNFLVRVVGISLKELMGGQQPGIFYLGLQIAAQDGVTSVISHVPTRAQVGGMPVNHAVARLKRVGGRAQLEQYSLAARMINANAMALPNKKGECPLSDDELGICISLEYLRGLLLSRLKRAGIALSEAGVLELTPGQESVQARFSDQSQEAFDWAISTHNNHPQFSQVQWQQSVEEMKAVSLPNPAGALIFTTQSWKIRDALCKQQRIESRSIGWQEISAELCAPESGEINQKNMTSAWFGAQWKNNILSLAEYNYWGAEFLLDPLQPVVSAIELLVKFLPESPSNSLLVRHFNDRMQEVADACREYIAANLMESRVALSQEILSDQDIVLYLARKQLYQSTGEPVQSAAGIIDDGIWAAFWQAFSVYPRTVSLLLQYQPLEAIVQQLRDIDLNIAEIIPRLPSHSYYISLINGGEI